MPEKLENARVLIYSHDTFGLGHLRRCRAIAHALVERYKGLSVLILTGSPIIGRFDFKARVDFVRIPGVIKLHNGDYTSLGLHVDIEQTLAMRESIIRHTAEIFAPDLFIVDKEPLGLRGEVEPTLAMLKARGVPLVLGLRDVLDAPHLLRREWQDKGACSALKRYYQEIWVYGDQSMGNPLDGLSIPDEVTARIFYTGYLRRGLPGQVASRRLLDLPRPYLLVTPGGGGDGADMIDTVLCAYEACAEMPWHGLFVLGPFMPSEQQEAFRARAAELPHVTMITFDNHLESLMNDAAAVVAMGGYNTFCEILSFDKRALLVPRTEPREEQLIRAVRAQALGLVMLHDLREPGNGQRMLRSLQALPDLPLPSSRLSEHFMGGLDAVAERMQALTAVDDC
ncbi:glycosyltransferase family protein [Motiliproteus sediminis]|uniref:glycosyltransferase family protein n=1 Tax=Motiliproteus sediminis TaxID=1468178 RepID=UPI001AEFD3B6|nr:glycosyltransferase [Motiliproteus sediminis]